MPARTAYVSDIVDAEHIYSELLALTEQSGDLVSRAVGMAGQMILVTQLRDRLPEAAAMSQELVTILDRMDGNEAMKYLIYQAVVWTQFLIGHLEEALDNAERQSALEAAGDPRTRAFSIASVGVIEIVSGEHLQGRAHLSEATEYIRGSAETVNQAPSSPRPRGPRRLRRDRQTLPAGCRTLRRPRPPARRPSHGHRNHVSAVSLGMMVE